MNTVRCTFLAIAAVALGAVSSGSPIIVKYDGSLNFGAVGSWNISTGHGTINTASAGLLGIKWWQDNPTVRIIDGTEATDTPNIERMYCVSPFEYLYTGGDGKWFADSYSGTVLGGAMPNPTTPIAPEPLDVTTKERVAWLANYSLTPGGITAGFSQQQIATAVQLAIWQAIVKDDGVMTWTRNSGDVNIFNLSNNIYAASAGQTGAMFRYFQDYSRDNFVSQDLIVGSGLPTGDPVPEPFTMALGAAGLVAAARMRRKR